MAEIRTKVPVKIENGAKPLFVSFEGLSDKQEHVALLFGDALSQETPLVRLHSSCLTGDIFGSQRCDCGKQLDEAVQRVSDEGGVILYLLQEGRSIGLYNKLDAYKHQIEDGLDTYAANEQIGHPVDARDYKVAAEMLEALGLSQIRLLSNNPDKATQLEQYGIAITERIPTSVYINDDNRSYLHTKRRGGHNLAIVEDHE